MQEKESTPLITTKSLFRHTVTMLNTIFCAVNAAIYISDHLLHDLDPLMHKDHVLCGARI